MRKVLIAILGATALLTGALATPAAAAPARPATSAVAASETYADVATGFCLDSNASRNVYTNPCGSGNNYQHWTPIANGSNRLIKNVATGYCLDSNASRNVYTNPCGTGNNYQNWR